MSHLFILLCLFYAACDSSSFLGELIEETVEEAPGNPVFDEEATRLTNQARSSKQQCGTEEYRSTIPLTWSNQLAEAALLHSQDMASSNYFDHTNQNGENPGVRIERTGYVARTWGENISAGQSSLDRVIEGWMESPGHCANIMNGKFTEFALAFAESSNSTFGIYWTMVLAAPM